MPTDMGYVTFFPSKMIEKDEIKQEAQTIREQENLKDSANRTFKRLPKL